MRYSMIFAKVAALLLLFALCISAPHARAQNQTPANAPFVGWTDPDTGLTWTKSDNGTDVDWNQANAYCSNLRLGGYTDWRLPTIDELQGIYDPSIDIPGKWSTGEADTWHVKGNLRFFGALWSSNQTEPMLALRFIFSNRVRQVDNINDNGRALCVRR